MKEFRRSLGLDLDLQGNPKALVRRMRSLIQAWKDGNPVARVTEIELGVPLRAIDQRWLEFREEYLKRNSTAIERWASRHAPSTYAGWTIDDEQGGLFYIGFVGDQERVITEFMSQARVLAPELIKPFPDPPRYSLRDLVAFQFDLLSKVSERPGFVNSIGINILANRVEVPTEHVAKVRRFLTKSYGLDNPALVVFARQGSISDERVSESHSRLK